MNTRVVVKKYPNRRLYDTAASQYITLGELAEKVRTGTDVLVQDASTGADLTQATLTQIILESRGGARLLPVPLLVRLIRMQDEALAEFFGRYVGWALELYVGAKQGARQLLPINPLATAPFVATDALARLVSGFRHAPAVPAAPVDTSPLDDFGGPTPMPPEPPPSKADVRDEMDTLRRQIEELRRRVDADTREPARSSKKKRPAKKR